MYHHHELDNVQTRASFGRVKWDCQRTERTKGRGIVL
jgi:hypothetical protein